MLLSGFVALDSSSPVAFAGLMAYEGYDFEGGPINGKGSGFGFTGNWINANAPFLNVSNDNVSLDSPAFPFDPVGNRIDDADGADARRVLANTIDLSQEGTTFFVSFLMQKNDTGAGTGRNVELAMWEGTTAARIRVGSTSSTAGPGMNESRFFFGGLGGTETSTIPVTYGQTYFVVLKGITSAAGTDQIMAAFYDPSETPPATEPVTWDFSDTFSSSVVLSQIRTTMGASAHGMLDEIRIGDTWESVTIPEPATAACVWLLGTIYVCGRRRSVGGA
jgi:hypothetical protein